MPEVSTLDGWIWIAAVFMLAGLVKGVIGLGLPTVAMALLALGMSPAQAAALLLVPSLLTNVWQCRPWHSLPALLRDTWPLHLGIFFGTLVIGAWLGAPAGALAGVLLGMVLVAYAAIGLRGWRWRSATRASGLPAGLVTGALTAMTGVFVVPAVPWLQGRIDARARLVQAMGLAFTVATVALGLQLAMHDALAAGRLGISLLLVVPALHGMALGAWLRARLSATLLRRCFFGGIGGLGAWMMMRALA
ncbi:sulfite exporter TauE/SafE family protein [Luteimonas fraxinea]|uniref:Probable membrane transporter protein n=1 Tax=Luteimonas fraxinea TaxID=2901869 RepID=A0ABS8UEY5_9GAMM|nr:sulfite exporter TauE/SafE family protein [Luteimonas fraxinea]MCD9097279.1 sulfite exporter TauE/SafE family protein [Luteimonas fraxinea]MCD9125156.1 sulfite exporter TauE/SafE family protein [Luteimonas fraxinea]UHH11542.1 sulfite exporter TauE/SafE family protein [Luteimonas fraxinea]